MDRAVPFLCIDGGPAQQGLKANGETVVERAGFLALNCGDEFLARRDNRRKGDGLLGMSRRERRSAR
jgi:hypothetical protein